jgi:hypothetical protein
VKSDAVQRFQVAFSQAGISGLSGHLFQVGGASFRHALGIPDKTLCQLGRWTSNCFQLYLRQYSVEEKKAASCWLLTQRR